MTLVEVRSLDSGTLTLRCLASTAEPYVLLVAASDVRVLDLFALGIHVSRFINVVLRHCDRGHITSAEQLFLYGFYAIAKPTHYRPRACSFPHAPTAAKFDSRLRALRDTRVIATSALDWLAREEIFFILKPYIRDDRDETNFAPFHSYRSASVCMRVCARVCVRAGA